MSAIDPINPTSHTRAERSFTVDALAAKLGLAASGDSPSARSCA